MKADARPTAAAEEAPSIPAVCAVLADETRWAILVRLGTAPASASALAAEMPVSRQAIAKHLAVLRDTGLVSAERVGREVRFVAVGSELSRIGRAIESVAAGWDRRLGRIKAQAEKGHPGAAGT
ncbi:ArsR/SmtB family transcription factor [Georgenia thermotolerans]|uniref:Metalloregulator ArsR/SmtB family transcription factor n=1 Tax=Georgenia thermotolerans TaxID=527326 RepID=A0A7J5UV29_9MICO|nr:metalloregulator ArsR/SmtB family transcription factor [Georgenia thermotolerans]KAE8766120.1 metalloregulator ArsR/SmtB family transcription factor [Georgenia thermotolerans]